MSPPQVRFHSPTCIYQSYRCQNYSGVDDWQDCAHSWLLPWIMFFWYVLNLAKDTTVSWRNMQSKFCSLMCHVVAFYYSGSILCSKINLNEFDCWIERDIYMIAGITIATGRLSGTTSWRAPLAIQIAPAGILAIFAFLLPEVRCPTKSTTISSDSALFTVTTMAYVGRSQCRGPLYLS